MIQSWYEYGNKAEVIYSVFGIILGLKCVMSTAVLILFPNKKNQTFDTAVEPNHNNSRVSCQKGPTRHAYAWQIGPFWQDTLDLQNVYKEEVQS